MWDDDRDDSLGRAQAGGDAGQHCVATSRYVPSSSPHARQRMQEQVYYLQCRDRQDAEDEQRELFTATDTGTSRAEARALLWANRSIKSVCFHRIILSPSQGLGITTTDEAQAWTRAVMEGHGRQVDRALTYVTAVHLNTGRPHVHILIAGEAGQPSQGGARRVVRFSKSDRTALHTRIAIDAAKPIRLAARGYTVQRIDFYDERAGAPGYNPLAHIHTASEALVFARSWISNTRGQGEVGASAEFWDATVALLLQAAILHLNHTYRARTRQAAPLARLLAVFNVEDFALLRDELLTSCECRRSSAQRCRFKLHHLQRLYFSK